VGLGSPNRLGHPFSSIILGPLDSLIPMIPEFAQKPFPTQYLLRFHFVPEGHTIVARRFIAGLATNKVSVPEGRLKLVLGCYESGVPDRFEVKFSAPRSEFRRPSGTQAM
jgi:hypothetical protein